jgi:hypothetical protein
LFPRAKEHVLHADRVQFLDHLMHRAEVFDLAWGEAPANDTIRRATVAETKSRFRGDTGETNRDFRQQFSPPPLAISMPSMLTASTRVPCISAAIAWPAARWAAASFTRTLQ